MANIKTIKLSDGTVYSIFDTGAIRLNNGTYPELDNDVLITGNGIVDKAIINGHLFVTEIDSIPVGTSIDNVLVQSTNGEIKKRSTDQLLEDIGGASYAMNDSTGVLSFKIGK